MTNPALMLQIAMQGLQNPAQLAQAAASKGIDPAILTAALGGPGQGMDDSAMAQNVGAALAPQPPTAAAPQLGLAPIAGTGGGGGRAGGVGHPQAGGGFNPPGSPGPAQPQQQQTGPSPEEMLQAFGMLQSVAPQPSAQAPIAPAIAPPAARAAMDPRLTQLLTGLLQPQGQVAATPTLGEIIGGQYRGAGRRF